jgi:hypothetical protein
LEAIYRSKGLLVTLIVYNYKVLFGDWMVLARSAFGQNVTPDTFRTLPILQRHICTCLKKHLVQKRLVVVYSLSANRLPKIDVYTPIHVEILFLTFKVFGDIGSKILATRLPE